MNASESGNQLINNTNASGLPAVAAPGESLIETDISVPKRIGLTIAFIVFGLFGVWAIFAPLGEYAHAVGTVTVRSYKKLVQHYEGGIIKDIRVQNGDIVNAGDVLVVIDNTQSAAQVEIINAQYKAELAEEARLIAERDNLEEVVYPPELDPNDRAARTEIDAQNQIFRARKATLTGEIAVLEQRVNQLRSSVNGLRAVRESKEQLATSYSEELEDFRSLLDEGFADKVRLRELERNYANFKGEAAEATAQIAATEIQIGQTQLEILQLQNRFQSEVVDKLSEVQTKLKDSRERLTALSDILSRTEIRATDSGAVNNLQVHSIGGVIPPGGMIAEIVPQADQMVIEARVSPLDRERVVMGQDASVRMSSFNSRVVPTLYGKVIGLSADSMYEEATGSTFYLARIELNPESLDDLQGQELVPGMPAEVFISTGSRTFLEYLMKPLSDSVARSFIED